MAEVSQRAGDAVVTPARVLAGEANHQFTYTRLQNATVPASAGFNLASLGFPASVANAVTFRQFPEIDVNQYYTSSGLTVSTFNPKFLRLR